MGRVQVPGAKGVLIPPGQHRRPSVVRQSVLWVLGAVGRTLCFSTLLWLGLSGQAPGLAREEAEEASDERARDG